MLNRFIRINRRLLLMGNSATKAKNKYNKAVYDQISIKPTKGTKSQWQSEAEKHGENLTEYITNAVKMRMESETEQNVQEFSETDILNNAFMKIAESCQKLLSAHLDLIDLFPNKKLCSPYRETISNYFWAIMNENIEQLLYRINDDEVKTDVHSILNAVNREVNIFKGHIDSNDLEEYLKQFNELMNLDEDE